MVFVVAICGVKSDEASSAVNDVGMLQVRARCLRGGEWRCWALLKNRVKNLKLH
jgi:hypothetical protein